MAVRGPAARLAESALLADYPFLPGAEALLGPEPPSVRALLEESAYERARVLGRARVLAAQDDPRGTTGLDDLARAPADVRVLSFLFARLVLSAAPSAAALRRWAVAESKRAHERLRSAAPGDLEEVARRLGFTVVAGPAQVTVPVEEYLRLASPIREAEFRLARQDLRDGRVAVGLVRASRLLEEGVRRGLATPLELAPEVVRSVREHERELLEEVARRLPSPLARPGGPAGPLRRERFPPCVRRMQRTLERGENLSHAGRFALATFLHHAGASFETIVDAYRGAPDFDEAVTRYQVEHITRHDGGRGYEMPECDTLRSHGLCARDGDPDAPTAAERAPDATCFEPTLRHPLQYYRRHGGTVVEGPVDPDASPAASPGRSAGPG